MAATLVAADEIRRVPMRTITMLFAAAVVLASVVAAALAMSQGTTAPDGSAAAGTLNPMEMMKNSKDLPVSDINDFI
jgi:hypothetical protein